MDSITHALTGAVIAKSFDDKKIGNWGFIEGIAMGYFPDADFVLGLFNPQFYIQYHRDFTHSLILIPFYAIISSWLFMKISRRNHFWSFYKIALTALLSHVILDLFTSFGTMIFSPFSEKRFSWDLLFIIDLIFSGIILLAFILSIFFKERSKWICRGSIISISLYVLFCFIQHGKAIEAGDAFSKNLKEDVIQIASLPQPLSPFRWANYIETKEKVYLGFIDLRKRDIFNPPQEELILSGRTFFERLKVLSHLYLPSDKVKYQSWPKLKDSPWVKKALSTEGIRFYYWFARFPVVKSIDSSNGRHRVEFMDLRFFMSNLRMPFVYYVEFDETGRILSEGFLNR